MLSDNGRVWQTLLPLQRPHCDPISSALQGWALVKIAVVELCQFRKPSFVKNPHPTPVDMEGVLVAQLFYDPVDVHGRYAESLADLLLRKRHLQFV